MPHLPVDAGHVELAALFASNPPKPQGMNSTDDWTKERSHE